MPIDGIKISVSNHDGKAWKHLPILEFRSTVDEATGEILDGTKVALFQGLLFTITQSRANPEQYYYNVRGSLMKYYNKGEYKAVDFDYSCLRMVLNELSNKFNINLDTSTIHNLEFGVNILAPVASKKLVNSLIVSKNETFGTLKLEGKEVGKHTQRQRYRLKIYNKGKREQTEADNLLRIELTVKKMDYLKQYHINTLADLLDINKVRPLGQLLLSEWQSIIYYDGGMKVLKHMTQFEKRKFLYYLRPVHWIEFSIKQRYRAKQHFNELINKYSTSATQTEISNLLTQKWQKLTAVICPHLNHDLEYKTKTNLSTFEQLEYTDHLCTFSNSKKGKLKSKKLHKKNSKSNCKKRRCKSCKKDISLKRVNTIYCSKKCNNFLAGKRRTKKKTIQRYQQIKDLERLEKVVKFNRLELLITYFDNGFGYSDKLLQTEINAAPEWIRKICQVKIYCYRKNYRTIELTSLRARKLIRLIAKQNNKL